jgi:hypothetical protein
MCVGNNKENGSVHSYKETMIRRNQQFSFGDKCISSRVPEIALYSIHWPHRHLHRLFQFTPSHTVSLRTILLLNLSIHLYIDIPKGLFPSHFFYQKPVCNHLPSDTVLLIATLILWAHVSELIRLPPLKSNSTPFNDRKYESGTALMKTSVLS